MTTKINSNEITFAQIKKNEKISRQVNMIVPYNIAYGETARKKMIQEVVDGNRKILPRQNNEENNRLSEEEQLLALRQYSLRTRESVWGDLTCCLFSMLTNPAKKDEFAFDIRNAGKNYYEIFLTKEGYIKAAMGPLVSNKGRVLNGYDVIVGDIKNQLFSYVPRNPEDIIRKNDLIQTPTCVSSISGKGENATLVFDRPVSLGKVYVPSSPKSNDIAYSFRLDRNFFNLAIGNNKKQSLVSNYRFIHSFAGMTSILAVGRREFLELGVKGLPRLGQMHKAILCLLLFMDGMGKNGKFSPYSKDYLFYVHTGDGWNIDCKKSLGLAREILPHCIERRKGPLFHNDPTDWQWRIKQTLLQNFIDITIKCLIAGIDKLNLYHELNPEIKIPITEKIDNNSIFLIFKTAEEIKRDKKMFLSKKTEVAQLKDTISNEFTNYPSTLVREVLLRNITPQ